MIHECSALSRLIVLADSYDRFGLTGGPHSRSPANIERAKADVVCGNFYINRGITGAMVGRQPFGGFKMSGGGTTAGGVEYLQNFLVPRVITENCRRRKRESGWPASRAKILIAWIIP